MYFNTTNEQGESLIEAHNAAMYQQDRIVDFFKANKTLELTPCEVHSALFTSQTPLTSVRRAITDATNQAMLIQTANKKKGAYGALNYCWRYKG